MKLIGMIQTMYRPTNATNMIVLKIILKNISHLHNFQYINLILGLLCNFKKMKLLDTVQTGLHYTLMPMGSFTRNRGG